MISLDSLPLAFSFFITGDIFIISAFVITCRVVKRFGWRHESNPILRPLFRRNILFGIAWFVGVIVVFNFYFLWIVRSSIIVLWGIIWMGMNAFDLLNDFRVSKALLKAKEY